ncbi:MAG TPA: peptidoglycan binding domain-containing protein [bacterium]|nr:peptidoglycan binding domain-containing protein [bacterium]
MAHKTKRILLIVLLIFLGLLLVAGFLLLSYQTAYASKIYRNISFGTTDLSGKTRKEAEKIITDQVNRALEKEITIKSTKEVKVKVSDTGITFNPQKIALEGYDIGRSNSFFQNLWFSAKTLWSKQNVALVPQLDQQKYDDFVKIAVEQLNIPTKDATLKLENGELKKAEGEDGSAVDTSDLDKKIIEAVSTGKSTIRLSSTKIPAKVSTTDFSQAETQANTYLERIIHFTFADKTFTPSKSDISLWIQIPLENDIYTVKLNDTNIKAYLNKIGSSIEIKRKDKKIHAVTGATIEEGVEGRYLDKDKILANLKLQIEKNKEFTIVLDIVSDPPKELRVNPEEGVVAGHFEGKYLDIDLTNQKLCRIEGPTVIDCYTVSSGKASMPTPTGEFSIKSKNQKQWSGKYGLWMPYWQQFNGDYGIHELPEWPGGKKEGEDHLGIPVSHGCVRLGIGAAQTVYDWTEIGTQVYIHK